MSSIRIPMAVCAAVAEVLKGSHPTLDALFEAAGAPGPPPALAHHSKWKTWLFRAGNDPTVDSLNLLGNLIEEFMDLPPLPIENSFEEILEESHNPVEEYNLKRDRLNKILEEHGFRYFRGGRVLLNGEQPNTAASSIKQSEPTDEGQKPPSAEELLQTLIHGLPRAMHPLEHRRKGAQSLSFDCEYDIQDLLHSQLRPWISDIRPEEFTPSYAGSSTRMDFLLPRYNLVLEIKRVRDKTHASKIGDELINDIEHYRRHADCDHLWCVIYDPLLLIQNPMGLVNDLEGHRSMKDGSVQVRVFVFSSMA
jgi:hypothetical protein